MAPAIEHWVHPRAIAIVYRQSGSNYTEIEFGVLGKVLKKDILLNLGINLGRLTAGGINGYGYHSHSTMFVSLQGELGLGGKRMSGGLLYKRKISDYFSGEMIGAWLRYRISI